MNPRQMGREARRDWSGACRASASRRLILFVVGGFASRNGLLDILKRQAELVWIELLGTATKLHALQLMPAVNEGMRERRGASQVSCRSTLQ
jgi:hypothetical protein